MWVITGTNGSIGGHLTSFYLSKNLEVLAVSASPDDVKKNISQSGISYDERNLHTYYDDYSKDLNDDKMKNILGQKKISCLVISSGEYFSGSFLSTSYEDYISNFRANFESCVRYISQLNQFMDNNSNIIVINSIASKVPKKTEGSYAISKKTISTFIDSIADELKDRNIHITDLVCGAVKSNITKDRDNFDKLIDPSDLAQQILDITKLEETLAIRRIEVLRSK